MTARFPLSDLDGLTVWDQPRLCLSVPQESGGRQPREGLRMFGVRTATDLIRVWDSTRPGAYQVRARIAMVLAGDEETGTAAAEAILASLAGHANLQRAQAFRRHDWLPA